MPDLIVFIGTSIEDASGPQSYRDVIDQRLGGGKITNRSLGGGSYLFPVNATNPDTIRRHIDAAITEFAGFTAGVKRLHLGGPINDIFGLDSSQIPQLTAAVASADAAATAAGWKVTANLLLPLHDGTQVIPAGWYPALQQRRKAYNDWVVQAFNGRYADLSWNLRETRDYDRADFRFFRDGMHPNELGAWLAGQTFPLSLLTT